MKHATLTGRRHAGWALAAVLLATAFGAVAPAHAASPTDIDRAQREADRLLLEEQQRQTERARGQDLRERSPSGATLEAPTGPSTRHEGPCHPVKHVALEGATLLPPPVRRAVVAPLEGRCVGLDEIDRLLRAVTAWYLEAGYSTTRAYIPEQNLGNGELRILVLEGLVEAIRVDGAGVAVGNAFPGLVGKPFNLRDFEQGIDQINRLASNSASLDIQPGAKPGTSVIVVRNRPESRRRGSLSLDNTGTDATGANQFGAVATFDDPLRHDDQLTLSGRINTDPNASYRLSRSLSGTWSLPYGRWTFSTLFSDYKYVSLVHGSATNFITDGDAQTATQRLDYLFRRDQTSKWSLTMGLSEKTTRNFLSDEIVYTSSHTLSVLDLGSKYTRVTGGTLWTLDLGMSTGLAVLGAMRDGSNAPLTAPRAQFTKFTMDASVQRPFKAFGRQFRWQSTLSAQGSGDVLFGSEQFLIGSPYSVRGFRTNSLTGDSGVFVHNDLAMPMTLVQLFGQRAGNGLVKPYVGFDIGKVPTHRGEKGGSLSGVAWGVDASARGWTLQLSYSMAINQPYRLARGDRYVFGRLSYEF